MEINIFATLVAAIVAYLLGGLWYSRLMFGEIWKRAEGKTKEGTHHGAVVMIVAFVFYVIAAFVFAVLIGPQPELWYAVKSGAEIGAAFIFTSFAINYLFAGRSLKLLFIDGTYHLVQFLIYGVVLGLWK